jgi:hypothetical protein
LTSFIQLTKRKLRVTFFFKVRGLCITFHFMLFYVMLCHFISFYVILCCFKPIYAILPFQTKFVLFLDCNEGTCIDRCLGRGRKGDSLEILKARFVGHYRDSMPIVEHFDKLGSLERVDTNRSVSDIFEEIKKVFSAYQT